MKAIRIAMVAAGLAVLGLNTGCLGVATPAMGAIITDVRGPIQAGDSIGEKEGKACAQSILGLFASGDASIATAARNGGITRIQTVDHHTNHMVVIGTFCTIVRGS